MVGKVVGIVVGIAGSGGRATAGMVGIVGSVGFGREGIWVLGKGGNVGLGRVGTVGSTGGSVAVGSVGIAGNGGSVALGKGGRVGRFGDACNRLRAASVMWIPESENAMTKDMVDGGGEKKGIVGIVVGIVGSEGIVVGIMGSGGNVVGIVGNDGLGREGTWVLGKGGNVGLGRVGAVGRVGNWVGNGGSVAGGSVGMAGKGGSVALGRGGIVGSVGAACGEACKSNTIPRNPNSIGYDSDAILSFDFEEEKFREVPAPTDYCLGLYDIKESWTKSFVIPHLVIAQNFQSIRLMRNGEILVLCDDHAHVSDNPNDPVLLRSSNKARMRKMSCTLFKQSQVKQRNNICLNFEELMCLIAKLKDYCKRRRLVVDGGGEKKGIVGIVVGMVGSEGIVVGIVGSGGSVAAGTLGIVGNVGLGRDGTWLLGKGGNVGLGRVGAIGRVGNWVVGNGGSVAVGSVGMAGKGGSVALGRGGIVGSVGAACGEAYFEVVVDLVHPCNVDNHPNKMLIMASREMMEELDANIIHNLCEGNRCADILSKMGINQGEKAMKIAVPPTKILDALKANMTRTAFPRGS
ncbi:hypothetical protein LguiA_005357 [Lonicera macranthoides]